MVQSKASVLVALVFLCAMILSILGCTPPVGDVPSSVSPSSDAGLSALSVAECPLSPVFSTGTLAYSVIVGNAITNVTVSATASNSGATVSGTGVTAVAVGTTVILVNVVAADQVTKQTYTITVTRESANPSADAGLAALGISVGSLSPIFASNITVYSAIVPNTTISLDVSATPNNPGASINGIGSKPLAVGPNSFPVVVTASDGNTTRTYTLNITRAAPTASSDATLSALTLSSGTLSPTFVSGTMSYTASVPYGTASVVLTATKSDSGALVSGDGSRALSVGGNSLNVVVTAADGVTVATYTVVITRAVSDVKTLSALSVSVGTLSPAFAPIITSYGVAVSNSCASIGINASPTDANASVAGTGTRVLVVGANSFTVTVTAVDGTVANYVINVARADVGASNDASLSALSFSYIVGSTPTALSLSPAFDPGVTAYSGVVNSSTTMGTILATPVAGAITPGTGGRVIGVGVNVYNVNVTAADGITTKTYTITITRAAPATTLSISSPLSGATVGGVVTVSGTYSGTAPDHIIVSSMIQQATATISGSTWSATLNTTGMINSNNQMLAAAAYDSASTLIGSVFTDVSIFNPGGAEGYAVSGSVSFLCTPPNDGTIYVFANNSSNISIASFTVNSGTGYPLAYNLSGLPDGSYSLAALYYRAGAAFGVDANSGSAFLSITINKGNLVGQNLVFQYLVP